MAGVDGSTIGLPPGPGHSGVHASTFTDAQGQSQPQQLQYHAPNVQMFSDWLNVSPSKDQPLFASSNRLDQQFQHTPPQPTYPQLINFQSNALEAVTPEMSVSTPFSTPERNPFRNISVTTPSRTIHSVPSSAITMSPVAQRTPLSFPTTGRTIYTPTRSGMPSLESALVSPLSVNRVAQPADILAPPVVETMVATVPSSQPVPTLESYSTENEAVSPVSPLRVNTTPSLAGGALQYPPEPPYQTTFLPYAIPNASVGGYGSSSTALSTDSLATDINVPASATSVTTVDGYSEPEDIFPSFVRTRIVDPDFEGLDDGEYPPSPTPLPNSRYFYDPASNPWALPALGPVFEVVPPKLNFPARIGSPVSAPSAAPVPAATPPPLPTSTTSSRRSTPAPPPPPKWFKSSPIALTEDWRLDRRAYESHRYGTRSKGKDLEGGSTREIGEDLEFIRRGGRGEDVHLLLAEKQKQEKQESRKPTEEPLSRPPSRRNNKRCGSELKDGPPAPKRTRKVIDISSDIERPSSAPPGASKVLARSRPSSNRPTPERGIPTRSSTRRPVPSAKMRSRASSVNPDGLFSTLAPPKRDDEDMSETDADAEGEADDDYDVGSSQPSQPVAPPRATPPQPVSPQASSSAPRIVVLEPGIEHDPSLTIISSQPNSPTAPSTTLSSPPPEPNDEDYSPGPKRSTRARNRPSRTAPRPPAAPSPSKVKVKKEEEEEVAIPLLFPNEPSTISDSSKIRVFPSHIPINDRFPLFYRRFPLCSYFDAESDIGKALYSRVKPPTKKIPGNYNHPTQPSKGIWNLYQPRFVRGTGARKEALCPICREEPERGGLARNDWFEMKTSAYNYHMQKFHGISPTNGLPFSPPMAFRNKKVSRAQKHQKEVMQEGQCHKCKSWIAVEGPNHGDTKVKELYWWKHACACHKGSIIDGESGFYNEDDVYHALKDYETSNGESSSR